MIYFSLLLLITVVIEYVHAKDERKDAFTNNTTTKFSGLEFSKIAESCSSKTEAGFLAYKTMMIAILLMLSLSLLPYEWSKLLTLSLIGIYLLYQLHHLYEWYMLRLENHGRKTAWLFVPLVITWWILLVPMLIEYVVAL